MGAYGLLKQLASLYGIAGRGMRDSPSISAKMLQDLPADFACLADLAGVDKGESLFPLQ
jgi:hypothetical protein